MLMHRLPFCAGLGTVEAEPLFVKLKTASLLARLVASLISQTSPATTFALAGAPGSASLEVMVLVTLWNTPPVVAVTETMMVQLPPGAGKEIPLAAMTCDPAVAVTIPPHVVESPFGVETIRPVGSVSLNATPVREATLFGL